MKMRQALRQAIKENGFTNALERAEQLLKESNSDYNRLSLKMALNEFKSGRTK